MATEIRDEKLDFWVQAGFNVLFIGRHGCGKSTRIFDAFNRAELRWQYFSAPTLDPWVDFVGVPREGQDERGAYIDLILPRKMRDDEIDAIFLDELNRAHPKIQNAVFELVQFRSINGRKFNNLRTIWASINPEDDDYKVEKLDPALKDRFQVWCNVPTEPNVGWFAKHYGDKEANAICEWWDDLTPELKLVVTPRRLQYVLDMHKASGDVRDVLPPGCNVSKLISTLNTGPVTEIIRRFFGTRSADEARKFLHTENSYASAVRHLQNPGEFGAQAGEWYGFFLPLLPTEKLSSLMATNDAICTFVLEHTDMGRFSEVIENIVGADQNKSLIRKIKKSIGSTHVLAGKYGKLNNLHAEPPYHSNTADCDWDAKLVALNQMPQSKTPERMKFYAELVRSIPPKLTGDQALATIEMLGAFLDRCWPQTIKDLRHLMGVVNHCINQYNLATGMGWLEMLSKYPSKFEKLLACLGHDKCKLDKKLLCPMPVTAEVA